MWRGREGAGGSGWRGSVERSDSQCGRSESQEQSIKLSIIRHSVHLSVRQSVCLTASRSDLDNKYTPNHHPPLLSTLRSLPTLQYPTVFLGPQTCPWWSRSDLDNVYASRSSPLLSTLRSVPSGQYRVGVDFRNPLALLSPFPSRPCLRPELLLLQPLQLIAAVTKRSSLLWQVTRLKVRTLSRSCCCSPLRLVAAAAKRSSFLCEGT